MGDFMEDVPEWIQRATMPSDPIESNLVEKFNFLKGAYIGHSMKIANQQRRIEELEEMVELARAYERERIAQMLESYGFSSNTTQRIRDWSD